MVRVGDPGAGPGNGRRARLSRILLLFLCMLCAAWPGLALAQAEGDDGFQRHHDRALALYRAHRYEESLAELQAAYAIRPDPRLLLNLGHACRRLHRPDEALRYYRQYRDAMPSLSEADRAAADEYVALAQRQVDEQASKERARLPTRPDKTEDPGKPALFPGPTTATGGAKVALLPGDPGPGTTLVSTTDRHPRGPQRFYQRWWFWTGIGAVTAGVILAAALSTQPWDAKVPTNIPIHDARF